MTTRLELPQNAPGNIYRQSPTILRAALTAGAFPLLVMPFYFFSGGPILPGTQWFAWIHLADTLGLLMLALEDERVHGPLNATAPETQTNRDFARAIGRVLGRAVQLRSPYVDALSLIQLRTLRALRATDGSDEAKDAQIRRVMMLSVNGVAAGLQNTG